MKKTFVVEGRGHFPDDMLRYDVCEYASVLDEGIARSSPDRRRVKLTYDSKRVLTPARWQSFGWYIVNLKGDTLP
jgi:hypothetical protein